MKRLLLLVTFLSSCSFERYSAQPTAEVRLRVPQEWLEPRALAGPGSYATVDCFVVDANGPGIDPMYDEANPFTTLDLGLNATWVSRAALLASGESTLSIKVPIGRSRTLRILGVTGSPAITDCAARTFAGYPNKGVLSAPPYPVVTELARSTMDVYTAKAVETSVATDPAEDLIPSSTLEAPPRVYLLIGNTDDRFGEGPPPSSTGAFQALTFPVTTYWKPGKARLDLVMDIDKQNVRSFRGVQVVVQAEGGTVTSCTGSNNAISAPSELAVGLWNEGAQTWIEKRSAIPTGNGTTTINFAGLNFESVRVPIENASFIYQDALYFSIRVQGAPASGCSTVNVTGFTATLFQ